MQLPIDTKIAGWKTVKDWNDLRISLLDQDNHNAWGVAYKDFFLTRLEDRYLEPLKIIKENGTYRGEGFSIMTIVCSLVEFIEGTFQGINYRYRRRNDPPLSQFEYNRSEDIFISFLTQRHPFSLDFNKINAAEFYKNIRCGLLHEARTKGKWTIWGSSPNNKLIDQTTNETIVYRDDFLEATKLLIKQYEQDLITSPVRKDAFIRKFDNVCEE